MPVGPGGRCRLTLWFHGDFVAKPARSRRHLAFPDSPQPRLRRPLALAIAAAIGILISVGGFFYVEGQNQALRDMVRSLNVGSAVLAADGAEVLRLLDRQPEAINLIVADWQMPGLSGLELLENVRARDPHLPFLMVTGKADIGAVRQAMSHGVSAYIAKPFSRAQIELKLRVLTHRMLRPINAKQRLGA